MVLASACALCWVAFGPQLWPSWLLAQQCCSVSFFCNHTLALTPPVGAALSLCLFHSLCLLF